MKKTFHQFLMVGALSLGFVSAAMAHNTETQEHLTNNPLTNNQVVNDADYSPEELQAQAQYKTLQTQQQAQRAELKKNITQRLQKVLEDKFAQKLVTQHAQLDIDIVPSDATIKANYDLSKKAGLANTSVDPVFGENSLERVGEMCQIKVAYDDQGNILPLVEFNKDLFKTIAFQNEQQREIAQEFVLLHEFFHCEFGKIENPIRITGKDAQFNERINYALKDQYSSGQAGALNYTDAVNEAFADVGAASMLYMEYAHDEAKKKDFLYVMDVVKTERYASYFQGQYDAHMTHFALNHVFEPETMAKLDKLSISAKNSPDLIHAKELRDMAFDFANRGTLELVANNKNMREIMLSENNVLAGIVINATQFIRSDNMAPENRSPKDFPRMWSSEVSHGVSYDLGQQLAAKVKGQAYFDKQGEPTLLANNMTRELLNIINNHGLGTTQTQEITQAVSDMKELQDYAMKNYKVSQFDYINTREELKADIVATKIATLREAFAKRSQTHDNAPTLSLK